MRLFRFDADAAKHAVTQFGSRNVVISGILRDREIVHIGCLHIGLDGLVGRHPATMPQLFLVVQGVGQAAFWDAGEVHETDSEEGMTAIVIEGPLLDPAAIMVPLSL